MPSLTGFSNNPLKTYEDIRTAAFALLTPLIPYQSPNGARIHLPIESGVHFDPTAAELEGFARPLWAIAALLSQNDASGTYDPRLEGWVRGFAAGTDPESEEYWGDVEDVDQRMVEMEILGFAVLMAPNILLGDPASQDPEVLRRRANVTRYLRSVNGKVFPLTNWLWFRVMANLALVLSCGVEYEELKESMDADLKVLDGFYVGDGWAADGVWGSHGRQMDYYSGSFAIQFSQLVYVKFAEELDAERCEVFRQRAKDFSLGFWRYFDENGAAIAFGRSLTYRFAMGAFWAAAIFAEIDLPAPLTPGVVKGLLLRHLRWWSRQPNIFYSDGTLTIGYYNPNMYLAEDYNSPQSPYWCMKSLAMLALKADHPFWKVEDEPHPLTRRREELGAVRLVKQPLQITVDYGNHHFMLSLGQHAAYAMKGGDAKYSKFAYSSAFGYSVPTGPLLGQLAPDNTIALSEDGGESWKVRNTFIEETRIGEIILESERLPILVSNWSPSKMSSVKIETTLIPPTSRWPDWHIRVHKISCSSPKEHGILLVEGGFAIDRTTGKYGRQVTQLQVSPPITEHDFDKDPLEDGFLEDAASALILSKAGVSGIRQLISDAGAEGKVLKPDANTNLITARSLIPMVQQTLFKGGGRQVKIITAVFAISGLKLTRKEIWKRWLDFPNMVKGSL